MRPKTITIAPAVLDRNGISLAETLGAAGNFAITGALATGGVATLDMPRHVGIYAAADNSAVTFTVYGADRNGTAITDAITGPTAGVTVKTTKNFATVTRVAAGAATVGNVEVGTTDELESQPIIVFEEIDWQVNLSAAAVLTWELQYTQDNLLVAGTTEHTAIWKGCGDSQANDVSSSYATPVPSGKIPAVRLAIKAFTSGTVTFVITPRR